MKTKISTEMFGEFIPLEIYHYYDGPLAFSFKHNEKWFYAHAHDFEPNYWDYLVRETTLDELTLFKDNKILVRNFILNAPNLYFIREHFRKDDFLEAFFLDSEEIDLLKINLPNENIYLWETTKKGQNADSN